MNQPKMSMMDMNQPFCNNDMMNSNISGKSNSNQLPLPFITGKIGNWDIAKEDMNKFTSNLRQTEWTTNQIYQNAKDIDITTSLTSINNPKTMHQPKKNSFNSLYLSFSPHLYEFENYKRELYDRKQRTAEEINNQRNFFLNKIYQGNPHIYDSNIPMETIYGRIKSERYNLIAKDHKLSRILEDILPFLQTSQNVNQSNNFHGSQRQSSGYNNQQYNQPGMFGNQPGMYTNQPNNSARYGNPNHNSQYINNPQYNNNSARNNYG